MISVLCHLLQALFYGLKSSKSCRNMRQGEFYPGRKSIMQASESPVTGIPLTCPIWNGEMNLHSII